jgi:hypothetical protein
MLTALRVGCGIFHAGDGRLRKKSDLFRAFAVECVKLAGAVRNCDSQAALIHIADAWLRLAEREEKMTESESSEEM